MITTERCEGVNEEKGINGGNERCDDEYEHEFGSIYGKPARDPLKTGFVSDDVDDFGAVEGIDGDEVEDHEHHVDVDGEHEECAEEGGHIEPAG